MKQTVNLLGIPFTARTKSELKALLRQRLRGASLTKIYTPNASILLQASRNPPLRRLLREADLLLPDGAGVVLASKQGGPSLPERITGIDVAEWMLRYGDRKGLSFFFLGGKPGVAKDAAAAWQKRIPSAVCN